METEQRVEKPEKLEKQARPKRVKEAKAEVREASRESRESRDSREAKEEPKTAEESKPRTPKPPPQNINEARSSHASKLLLSVNKITRSSKDAYIQLLLLVFREVLQQQHSKKVDFLGQFSLLRDYCSNTGMNIYYDNENIKAVIRDTVGDDEVNMSLYLKILYGMIELINSNILNHYVYVDYTKFGKNKLFNIIETVVFTQLIPAELTKNETEFKQALKREVKSLKDKLLHNKKLTEESTVGAVEQAVKTVSI